MRGTNRVWLLGLGVVLLAAASCSGDNAKGSLAGGAGKAADFVLRTLADPLINQQLGAAKLDVKTATDGADVIVQASGMQSLRSIYFELSYNPESYQPDIVDPGRLDSAGQTLVLSLLDEPGVVRFGQVLLHPREQSGISGDGVLATVHFKLRRAGEPTSSVVRIASAAPATNASRTILGWDSGAMTLGWEYYNQGDYNQDGAVGLTDLTPLGVHFGETGPFSKFDAISVVDGNSDQAINLADLAPIGINFGCNALGGYQVFETTDKGQYPVGNDDASLISALSTQAFNTYTNDPQFSRLHFQANVLAPVPQAYYWVRPADNHAHPGTPSNLAGGPPAALPAFSLTDPPALGSGADWDPYRVGATQMYHLKLQDPVDGDVTLSPDTAYFVTSPEMATIDKASGTITTGEYFIGTYIVMASYKNVMANWLYFYAAAPYSWDNMDADQGTPPGNNVGKYCSLANIGGQPGVAYYDETVGTLRYAYYSLLPVPAWHPSLVDNSAIVGRNCTLMELAGHAAICYLDQDNQALKFAYASTATPAGPADWAVHTVFPGTYPMETDMHLIGGTVAIVINDALTDQLLYIRTYEAIPNDITDWVFHAVTGSGDSAAPSLELINTVPAIAYYDNASMDLRYCYGKVFEPHAPSDWVMMAIDSADAAGLSPQLYAMDGFVPVVAYFDWTHGDLKFAQAHGSAPLSAADWDLTYIWQSPDTVGSHVSLAGVNGHLCLAAQNYTTGGIVFLRNKSPYPRGPQDWQLYSLASGPGRGDYLSIASLYGPPDDVPGVAYYDAGSGNLRFALGVP